MRESKRTDGYTDEVELQQNYLESNIENFISSQHFQNDSRDFHRKHPFFIGIILGTLREMYIGEHR